MTGYTGQEPLLNVTSAHGKLASNRFLPLTDILVAASGYCGIENPAIVLQIIGKLSHGRVIGQYIHRDKKYHIYPQEL
jgi:hypothetical protein